MSPLTSHPLRPLIDKATGLLGLRVIGLGLGFSLQIALARWMGLWEYGTYAYVLAWVDTIALLAGLGLPKAALRFVPEYETTSESGKQRGFIRWAMGAAAAAGAVIGAIGTAVLFGLLAADSPGRSLWLLGLWAVPLFALRRFRSNVLLAAHRIVWAVAPDAVLRPLVIVVGAFVLFQLNGALSAFEAMALSVAAIVCMLAAQSVGLRLTFGSWAPATGFGRTGRATPRYELRRWLRISSPLLATAVFLTLLMQADLLMLGLFLDAEAVGLYRAASRFGSLVLLPMVAVNRVIAPLISANATIGDTRGLQRLVGRAVRLSFWPSAVLGLIMMLLAKPMLSLFGPDFVAAHWPMRVLIVGHLATAACGPVADLLDFTGHQDHTARVTSCIAVVNVALNAIAIPILGIVGAALATGISFILRAAWLYVLAGKLTTVRASILDPLVPGDPQVDIEAFASSNGSRAGEQGVPTLPQTPA